MLFRKMLWPTFAIGGLLAIVAGASLPHHNAQAVLFALSDATASLFQYDVTLATTRSRIMMKTNQAIKTARLLSDVV